MICLAVILRKLLHGGRRRLSRGTQHEPQQRCCPSGPIVGLANTIPAGQKIAQVQGYIVAERRLAKLATNWPALAACFP